ncbi:MAG: chemotaxis response regulator protein-glutamate methylesterase [Erythrobacter sp.]|uniref:protein-glutamate methylesterase/protein-glutamine glutaminase n=1 Tax=Erythrobacter sp. TaxID=1042 RepID=UPI00261B23DA|nr:chemotaxis response regulator protein-glutamate methylesterase [Erythrobacter sp.]MDJ0977118.1 chemotaxis response regulator protein-glutamate methylesterase [Erythrobacter sp.]
MSVRVLIVDDSALMRTLIARKLTEASDIEVIGTAQNSAEARKLIKALDPDVVTLDIEMPGMDGLSFLSKIMELRPTPVIIVSGATGPGAEATARAMRIGAVGCYAKSTATRSIKDDDGGLLANLVREAAQVTLSPPHKSRTSFSGGAGQSRAAAARSTSRKTGAGYEPALICIGSSTGGVEALHALLSDFPENCPPTLIVQHVNGGFAGAIAKSLDQDCPPHVSLAQADRPLRRGEVLIAPGDARHLMVARSSVASAPFRAALRAGNAVSGHRPSVDALFTSAAAQAGKESLGILLTGMGRDGANGLLAMKQAGAHTIAQDQQSCVVFGMPRAAIELGAAADVLPIDRIAASVFGDAPATRVSSSPLLEKKA